MNSPLRRAVILVVILGLLGGSLWFGRSVISPASELAVSGPAGRKPAVRPAADSGANLAGGQLTPSTPALALPQAGTQAASIPAISAIPPAAVGAEGGPFAAFSAWSAQYLAAGPEDRLGMVEAGRQIAIERRAALAELISRDPQAALARAVPMVVRQDLPAEVLAQLEERINTKAIYNVFAVFPVPGAAPPAAPIFREVDLGDGVRYAAHVYGRRLGQPTLGNAHLNGIALDGQLALDERPLRVLEPGERPGRTKKPVFTDCPISGKSVVVAAELAEPLPVIDEKTPAVEFAGEIHYLCGGGHINQLEEGLVAAEGGSGGAIKPTTVIASTQSTGVKSLLYMRLAYAGTTDSPQTEVAAYWMMRQVNDFFVENSYGKLYLVTTVTPLIVLPRTEAEYGSDGTDLLREDAQEAARKLGYDTDHYDLDIVAYEGGPGDFGGMARVGTKGNWLKSINAGVACHELGHNLGLMHANFWNTGGKSTIGPGVNDEYGNSFDTMGNAAAGEYHFMANHKAMLRWLPTAEAVHTVTASGTYRLFAMDQPRLDPGNRYAIKVRKDDQREYWAEFRQKSFGGNRWVKDGIFMTWSAWSQSSGGQLLDTTPGSADGRNDAPVVIGRTFSDFESGIHFTPIGKAGTDPESMDVVVNLGTFPNNQAPKATIAASSTAVASGVPVTFTATASDPDGDALSYAWDFGDKTFSTQNSSVATKSWTTAGEYLVRCVVSDMKGQTASRSVVVRVGSPTTFQIRGKITLNGTPMANVHVRYYPSGRSSGSTDTDSNGIYTIVGLSAGSVTIQPTLEGNTFSPGFTNPVLVGPNFTTANFTATAFPQVRLSVTDADCAEGSANPGKFTFTRTGSTAASLTLSLLYPSGSAGYGGYISDYSFSPELGYNGFSTLTIPAGQSSIDLVLTAKTDSAVEGPETARLYLLAGTGYVVAGEPVAAIEIRDANSSLPQVSVEPADDAANENGDPASFTISRKGPTAAPMSVFFTLSGSATNGTDYESLTSSVIIPAGATSTNLLVKPLADTLVEGTESVTLSLSNNAAYLRSGESQTAFIVDQNRPTVTVTASDENAGEAGGDTGTFLVTRSGPTSLPLTVDYALTGSALQGADYLSVPGILTIPGGSSYGTVTITPIADGLGEEQESVVFQLAAGSNYISGAPFLATVNITDKPDVPVVTVDIGSGFIRESGSKGSFSLTTKGSGTGNITVRYTISGTATSGVDYVALSGSLTMGRNTVAQVVVTPLADALLEDAETITLTLDPDPAYSFFLDGSATLVLPDDDQATVAISSAPVVFGEAGGTAALRITRSGASTATALSVNYTLSGTATNGADYKALPGTITIPAGAAGVNLNVAAINDTEVEGTESLVVSLAPGAYGRGVLRVATCYLLDNEVPPNQVRFGSSTGTGSEGVTTVAIPVTLSAAAAGPVTVEYLTNGGSALGGIDYKSTPGTLTFAPGEVSKTIPLTIIDDSFVEGSETVIVKLLYANGAALGTSSYTYTIADNDVPAPTIAFATSASGASEAQPSATLIVSLSSPQLTAVTVGYGTTGGTASSGTDYTLPTGTLTFAPGETAKVIPNSIINDSNGEPDETLVVALSAPSGATLGALKTHTYRILDDDASTVTLSATDASASEAGTDTGTFLVTRTGSLINALSVNLNISGTAESGLDYQALGTPLVIPAGSATANLTVVPSNDFLGEGSETVIVAIAAGTGYGIGSPGRATVTILDDEPVISITASDPNAAEAGLDPGVFTLKRTGSTTKSLAVTVELSGTAALGSDYTTSARPIVFAAGASTSTLTVTPIDDSLPEGVELLVATIPNGPYLISGSPSSTVSVADDDYDYPPVITLISPTTSKVAIPPNVGLLLSASATDDGRPKVPGALTTTWTMLSGPGVVTFANPSLPSTAATFSSNGIYVLRLTADDGATATTLDVTVTVNQPGVWTAQDIGAPAVAGSYTANNGTLTVKGGGSNISGAVDQLHFVSQTLTGDGQITARVVSMSGGGNAARAGVMLRNSTATNARTAIMSMYLPTSTAGAASYRTRATDGGSISASTTTGTATFPSWVRVVRSGNSFAGYTSPDGQTWTQVGTSKTITMDATLLVGLIVSANSSTALCTGVFDNITITNVPPNLGPKVSAGPPSVSIYPATATLAGVVSDDGKPLPATLTSNWSKLSGPGTVSFANAAAASTTATFSAPGIYVLRLRADDGQVRTFNDVTVTTTLTALPTLSISATTSAAAESGPTAGVFTVTRTGATTAALTVAYQLAGTATMGTDYQTLSKSLVIPIGALSATITVNPLLDALAEGSETVIATLAANANYLVGSPSAATLTISDAPFDLWRSQNFGANAGNATIAGLLADPDGDTFCNLLEYALAGNPLVADLALQPQLAKEANDLTLTYRRPSTIPDLLYSIESRTPSGSWIAIASTEQILSDNGTIRQVKARVPIGSLTRMMIRLRVTRL